MASRLKPIRISDDMQKDIDAIKKQGHVKDETDAIRYALSVTADTIATVAKTSQREMATKLKAA